MSLDIQYKCYIGVHRTLEEPDGAKFPMLKVRYRESGKRAWIRLPKMEADMPAYSFYPEEYDGAFDGHHITDKCDYNRLIIFRKILSDKFCGSLRNYVRRIVETEVAMRAAEIAEKEEIESISKGLSTYGWRSTTINGVEAWCM